MKKLNHLVRWLFVLTFLLSCKAHKDFAKEPEPKFANQGEQEDYWAKKLFADQYQIQDIERFTGFIQTIGKDTIKYNDKFIIISNSQLKEILTTGLLYPESLTIKTLQFSDLEVQLFLSHSIKIKRFKFWLGSHICLILSSIFLN